MAYTDRDSRFWDKIAKKYASRPVPDETIYQTKLAKTREYLTPDSRVFEFGCGTGSTALNHAPYAGHILATDISPAMIAIARDKAAAAGISNVTFESTGIHDIQLPDGSVDVVMAHSILHLLSDPAAVLARMHALLKPGGVIVSSTVCPGEANAVIRFLIKAAQVCGIAPFITFFTQPQLEAMFVQAGFSPEFVWRPTPKQAAFIIARKPG
jgi:ubiquinone/menaquinone biosynthesis C-methylase UbiE